MHSQDATRTLPKFLQKLKKKDRFAGEEKYRLRLWTKSRLAEQWRKVDLRFVLKSSKVYHSSQRRCSLFFFLFFLSFSFDLSSLTEAVIPAV